ncbi:MAG: class I SAM-dependent methyltransferase [Candidatus Altiarchaeales archaeon]|nr:class I SAM-dependent methyltransferase [Candidatus Altiarchaeales archaeon]
MRVYLTRPNLTNNRDFHLMEKEATMGDETSLSHFLRDRNSFVRNGWAYGEALAHFILERGLISGNNPHIVEVGGGLGDVARTAIPVFLEAGKDIRYTMVDLSPKLQEAQRRNTAEFGGRMEYVSGDAEKIDRLVPHADFVLCNEVIADYRAIGNIPLTRGGKPTGLEQAEGDIRRNQRVWNVAWDMIDQYHLTVPKEDDKVYSFALNYGAIKFVEALHRLLPPGGSAFLVEFTSPFARTAELPKHQEHSISKIHMKQVLDTLGFKWQMGNGNDYLGIDPNKQTVREEVVALWLMIGQNPYDFMKDPKYPSVSNLWKLRPYQDRLIADPAKYKVLDRRVTPEEFKVLAKQMGWNIENPETEPIGKPGFDYYILQKPDKYLL